MSWHADQLDQDHPSGPTELERLAAEAGVDPSQLRDWLTSEVERRRRDRYRMHSSALAQLDKRLERAVAETSDVTG